ncbi:diacylglycerol kinase [Listeria costaricensis]|uniref:diacylglycerol kinase n=1 Tax=Listeria costaricensis TaxID=2026604 RepID=UPI001F093C29|nr:diacylglycerol kinase [Listeria costaricensis]
MRKVIIIYNPVAGKRKFKQYMPSAEQILTEAGFEVTLMSSTSEPKSVTKLAEQAARDGYDAVIGAGGDGTINEVVNGLMQVESRPVLGVMPVGTTNDYARALGLNHDPLEAVRMIADWQTITVDVGQANDDYFINNAAAGKITEITYAVEEKKKNRYGRLAYLLDGFKNLPKLSPTKVDVTYDDQNFSGPILLMFLNKTHTVGGLESLCPTARLNDGYVDLLILKKVPPLKLLQLFLNLKSGKHLSNENVIHARVKKVSVHSPETLNISFDGVYGGEAPYEFKVCESALKVFADKEKTRVKLRD